MGYEARQSVTINITYGHDDTHVIVQFSQMIQNNRMTEKEAKEMIAALKGALAKLVAHKKNKNKPIFQS